MQDFPVLLSFLLLTAANQLIIPFPTDIVFLGLIQTGINPFLISVFALVGLLLGATIDFVLGKYGLNLIPWVKRKEKSKAFKRSEKFYKTYGKLSLLFTWLPFVGKYLPIVAGVMQTDTLTFYFLFILGRILHLAALIFISTQVPKLFWFSPQKNSRV